MNAICAGGEDPVSLSHLALNRYWVVTPGQTDGRTDRIPIANTRSQQYLPVQLWRVKIAEMLYGTDASAKQKLSETIIIMNPSLRTDRPDTE